MGEIVNERRNYAAVFSESARDGGSVSNPVVCIASDRTLRGHRRHRVSARKIESEAPSDLLCGGILHGADFYAGAAAPVGAG